MVFALGTVGLGTDGFVGSTLGTVGRAADGFAIGSFVDSTLGTVGRGADGFATGGFVDSILGTVGRGADGFADSALLNDFIAFMAFEDLCDAYRTLGELNATKQRPVTRNCAHTGRGRRKAKTEVDIIC